MRRKTPFGQGAESGGESPHPAGHDFRYTPKIAKAFYNKGRMADAVRHFDRVMAIWGERRPRSPLVAQLRLLADVIRVLRNIYLPSRRKKRLPSQRTNDKYDIAYQRGIALAIIDTRRMVMDTTRYLGALHGYDLNHVSNGIITYASGSGLFSLSGISLGVARRILRYARTFIQPDDVKCLFTYGYFELLTDCVWGRWDIDLTYDDAIVDRCIQEGDLFTPPGHVFLGGLIRIEQGRFAEVEARLKKLQEIIDGYDNDYARSRRYALWARYLFQKRQLLQLLPEAEEGITWAKRSGQKLWLILSPRDQSPCLASFGPGRGGGRNLGRGPATRPPGEDRRPDLCQHAPQRRLPVRAGPVRGGGHGRRPDEGRCGQA